MYRLLALSLIALNSPIQAQFSSPLTSVPAASDAQIAQERIDRDAAIAAAMPPDCTAPLSDGLTASAGAASRCIPRMDNQRATQVQPANVVTDNTGAFAGTWPKDWPSRPATAWAQANTGAAPTICQMATWDTHSFSGQCWQVVPATVQGVVSVTQAVVASTYRNAAAGVPVSAAARQ